jgi:D-alanine transaminase
MTSENDIVYLNGRFLPLKEARISVLDRGFLFGDGVYEVIPAYGGRLFRLDEHLARLESSLDQVRIRPLLTHQEWQTILERLLPDNRDRSVYLQVTRGVAEKRDHAMPARPTPTVFAMSSELEAPYDVDAGVGAITLDDTRWKLCQIKAITLLANILLRQEAIDRNCAEAILVRNGVVSEGAASNVFAVIDGVLVTPPKSHDLLPGITRDLVLELAQDNAIEAREAGIPAERLSVADEIWLTSSTREILPVVELDGKSVGTGAPGPIWRRMHGIYQTYKQSLRLP